MTEQPFSEFVFSENEAKFNEGRKKPRKFSHPGPTWLAGMMKHNGIKESEFSKRTGIPLKNLNAILKGRQPITEKIAETAGKIFNLSNPGIFVQLQWQYDHQQPYCAYH